MGSTGCHCIESSMAEPDPSSDEEVSPTAVSELFRQVVRNDSVTEYFGKHQLESFFSKMLLAVGKARPDDPYLYMKKYLDEHQQHSNQVFHAVVEEESKNVQDLVKQWQKGNEKQLEMSPVSAGSVASSQIVGKRDNTWIIQGVGVEGGLGEIRKPRKRIENIFRPVNSGDKELLTHLLSWETDPFDITEEQLMRDTLSILLIGWNVTETLPVEENNLKNYINAIATNYDSNNSYHNFRHAFSVMASVGILITEGGQPFLDEVETFSALISGMTHDVGHPGMGSDYYVKAGNELAIRYNDIAVLENMHASLTFIIMRVNRNDILQHFTKEQYELFRKTSVSLILSTDMKVHFDLTSSIQEYIDKKTPLDAEDAQQRTLYQRCLVHAGDLSNPVLPTHLSKKWAYRVVLEFYSQATREKEEGLPFSPFMEHHPDNTLEFTRLQIGFCSFVVKPFWTTLVTFYQSPHTRSRLRQLEENIAMWNSVKEDEEEKLGMRS